MVIWVSQHLPELAVIQQRLLCTEVSPNGVFKFGNRQPGEKTNPGEDRIGQENLSSSVLDRFGPECTFLSLSFFICEMGQLVIVAASESYCG